MTYASPALLPHHFRWGWSLLALSLGVFIAVGPWPYSALLLGGGVLFAIAIWEPAFAVGCALAFGPTRALLAALGYAGVTYDLGQIFFAIALLGWLARCAIRREIVIPRLVLLVPLSLYLWVGLLSLLGAPAWEDGINEAIKWLEVILVLIIVYSEAQRGRLVWLIGLIVMAGLAQAGAGLWQYGWRGLGPESFQIAEGYYRAYGSFEQPNPYAGYLGLIWPIPFAIALEQIKRSLRPSSLFSLLFPLFSFLASLFILLGLYVSFSRGAWLGAVAALGVMLVFFPTRWQWGVGLGMLLLVGGGALAASGLLPASIVARFANVTDFLNVVDVRGVSITDANFAIVERLAHWQAASEMIRAYPWLGVGLGNYIARYPDFSLINWSFHLGHAHNIYLHTWAETGLFGLLAYLSVWATALGLTFAALRHATGYQRALALGLLGVWAHLLTHQIVDNLHVNNIDLLLATELGILSVLVTVTANERILRVKQSPHRRETASPLKGAARSDIA